MEAQNIMRYAAAVTTLFIDAERIGDDVAHQLQSLVRELTKEGLRRLERAQEALEIVWEREEQAKKAPHARKEG